MPREQSLLRPNYTPMLDITAHLQEPLPPLNDMFRLELTSSSLCVQSEDVQGSVCQVDMEQVQLQKVLSR